MSAAKPRRRPFRILTLLGSGVTWLILLIGVLSAFGALWFDLPKVLMPHAVATGFGVAVVVAAVLLRPRWRAKLGIAGAVILTMIWWFTLKPQQYRDWKPEVAETAHAEIASDLVTLHNVRNFVYLYRLKAPRAKEAFLEYVRTVNELHASPRWYNAITNNCTTAIRNQRAADERQPFDWRMLVNGYGDEMLYDNGLIDRSLPFADLKKLALINARAKAADGDPDFSGKIRAGLPGMGE